MKIEKKDIQMLLGFIGVAAAIAVYFLYFKPNQEKIAAIKAENEQLNVRIAELEDLRSQREYFIEQTEILSGKVDDIYVQFPEMVSPEDAIQELIDVENASDTEIQQFSYGQASALYTPIACSLEGMNATPEMTEPAEGEEAVPVSSGYALMQEPISYAFAGDLNQFMRAVNCINDRYDRDVINNISLVYDSSSGLLAGQMNLNKYYVTGRGLEYAPATFNVPTGSRNLFSTYKQSAEPAAGESNSADGE